MESDYSLALSPLLVAQWTQTNVLHSGLVSLTCSADGTTLIGGQYYAPVCISTNGGVTWTATSSPLLAFSGLACSADASRILGVAGQNSSLWITTNAGASWSSSLDGCAAAAFTPDGSKLTAVMYDNSIYCSTNSGLSWTLLCVASTNGPSGRTVAFSSDCTKVVETVAAGGIYTWQTTPILSVGSLSGNAVLSWPAVSSSAGFRLQWNYDIFGHYSYYLWSTISQTPTIANGSFQVIVTNLPDPAFFRLSP
jgi:hypothetical protein